MKFNRFSFPLIMVASLFLIFLAGSCKKEKEVPGNWVRFSLINKGEKTNWLGNDVSVQFQLGKMVLKGTNDDGSSLQLATDEAIVGTYLVEDDKALGVLNLGTGNDPLKIFAADSGSVTITTADLNTKLIQGTFELWFVNPATQEEAKAFGSFRSNINL